jgi:hypothetical protein
MRSFTSTLVCAALVLLLAGKASAINMMIFTDYITGLSYTLYAGLTNPGDVDATFNTVTDTYTLPGSHTSIPFTPPIQISLDWAGDVADVYSFAVADNVPVIITAIGANAALCNSTTGMPVTVSASNPQCNYTIFWSSNFNGVISLTYNTGSGATPDSSQQISIPFVNGSSFIVGDPQFVGLRGQSYQVHGIDGAVYNIISERSTQVNSRFVFLTQGECPMIGGFPDTNCWSHPGSYLADLSFQQVVDGKLHAALVTAGPAKKGFAGVQMDGKVVAVGQTVQFGSFSITVKSSHSVEVTTEHFAFQLSNSDMFLNQAVRATVPLSQLQSHGLLGQTHSSKTHPGALRHVEGSIDDYIIADNDVFGTDFVYNQFQTA